MLKLKKPKSSNQRWYEKNKQRLSEKRKRLYAENSEYRQKAIDRSRRRRSGEQLPAMPPVPADAPISFKDAAGRLGIGVSTLREWRRKGLFPDPKHYNGGLWFTEKQVELLRLIKEFFKKYKMRPWKSTQPILEQLRASILAGWN